SAPTTVQRFPERVGMMSATYRPARRGANVARVRAPATFTESLTRFGSLHVRSTLCLTAIISLAAFTPATAQRSHAPTLPRITAERSVYLDSSGVIRWQGDQSEVA